MRDTVIFTVTSDSYFNMMSGARNSVKKFYPGLPYLIFNYYENQRDMVLSYVLVGRMLSEKFKRVIMFNADQVMCYESPELFGEFDLAMPVNNLNFNKDPNTPYLNVGTVVTTKKEVWDEMGKIMDTGKNDQEALNQVFYSGKFKCAPLDHPDRSYGIKEMDWYRGMEVKNNVLLAGSKVVSIFHAAGQDYKDQTRIRYELFNAPVQRFFNYLIT